MAVGGALFDLSWPLVMLTNQAGLRVRGLKAELEMMR